MLATALPETAPSPTLLTVTLSDFGPLIAVAFPFAVRVDPPIEQTMEELDATSQLEESGSPATDTEFANPEPEMVTDAPEQPGKLAGEMLVMAGGE